jgi:UMF1 family MFS transporter
MLTGVRVDSQRTERWLTPRALAWALYDFANTVWAISIISRYFPLWLKEERGGLDFHIALANGLSLGIALVVELTLTPLSDATGRRRVFVSVFTLATIASTFVLGFEPPLLIALALFALANTGVNVAATFYNAMLHDVSTERSIDRVSALGVGLAYVGTITGLLALTSIGGPGQNARVFVPTAMMFLAASLPLMLVVRERRDGARVSYAQARRTAWRNLARLVRFVWIDRRLRLFFLASICSSAAASSVALFMAPYSKEVIGLHDQRRVLGVDEVSLFLLLSALFAVAGAFVAGECATRFGELRTFVWTLVTWCVGFAVAIVTPVKWPFWIVGPLVGIAFAGSRVLGRAVLLKIVGPEDLSKIFAVFGVSFKAAAVGGPLVWAVVVQAFEPLGVAKYRMAVGSQLVLLIVSVLLIVEMKRTAATMEAAPASQPK